MAAPKSVTQALIPLGPINELIEDLVKGHGASRGKGGRPKKGEERNCGRTPAINGTVRHRKGAASLAARLAESADPKVRQAWKGYLEGKHRSVTAAVIACGTILPQWQSRPTTG